MNHLVSENILFEKIGNASESEEGFLALRNFVFDYYAAEDDYVFKSKGIEMIFAVLLPYLHFEEAFGDRLRGQRLKRLRDMLRQELTPESAILALEYDQISALLEKLKSGLISEIVFEKQLRKISPVNINWKKVIDLYNSYA